MSLDYTQLPRIEVVVETQQVQGPLELWRNALGHGGINYHPLPARVVEGAKKLKPRLIRVFLQEHFAIYPERGRFDWSRLDPFLESLAKTGAKVVVAICLKPPVLFPTIDHSLWRPSDWAEWQTVIRELVKRYSVERQIVTYWEIGNETDIGESGGCPYLIPDPKDYAEYYTQTIAPILEVYPEGKVGGPAACWVTNEPLPGLVKYCRETGTRLDFISWHLYSDSPEQHAKGVELGKQLLEGFPGKRPEMLVTEWSKSFDAVSAEDMAFVLRRAANIAANALAMREAGLDWSFYYHVWDQTFYREPFAPFYSEHGLELMETHWNRIPHRFGMFGVNGEARPQYFLYQMFARMGGDRLAASCEEPSLRVLASAGAGKTSALLVNFDSQESSDRMVSVRFPGLEPGVKTLRVYRIDADARWDAETLELTPREEREVDTGAGFYVQLYVPGDTVTLVELTDRK